MKNMRPQGGGGGQPPNAQDRQAMMEKMQKANEENEAKVEEILDPKQFDRLVGLYIQASNLQSLNSKLVATRLGITEDQKTKMAEIAKANGEKMRELFQAGFGPDAREKMSKMRDEAEAKIKEVSPTNKSKTWRRSRELSSNSQSLSGAVDLVDPADLVDLVADEETVVLVATATSQQRNLPTMSITNSAEASTICRGLRRALRPRQSVCAATGFSETTSLRVQAIRGARST